MKEESPETTAETRKLAAITFTDMVGFSEVTWMKRSGIQDARQEFPRISSELRLAAHNRVIEQAAQMSFSQLRRLLQQNPLPELPSLLSLSSRVSHRRQ
jgi:hypothetical protein